MLSNRRAVARALKSDGTGDQRTKRRPEIVADPTVVRLNEPFAIFKRSLAFPTGCNKHFLNPPIVVADLGIRVTGRKSRRKTECQHPVVSGEVPGEPAIGEADVPREGANGIGLVVSDLEQQCSARCQ